MRPPHALILIFTILALSAQHGQAGVVAIEPSLPGLQRLAFTTFAGAAGSARTTRNGTASQNEAMGQTVLSSAFTGDELDLQVLYLRTSQSGNDIVIPSTGTHEIEVWIGEWDDSLGQAGATIYSETFDVAGMTFDNDTIYSFTFDNSFDVWNPGAPGQDYAFQLWWTSDDGTHQLGWDVDTGQGFVPGAIISDSGSGLTNLPFDDNATGNSDLFFAFSRIPEPSSFILTALGLLTLIGRRTR